MLDSPGWEALQRLIDNGREFAWRELQGGPTGDAAYYARQIGWLSGLDQVKEVAEAFLLKADEINEQLNAQERALAAETQER